MLNSSRLIWCLLPVLGSLAAAPAFAASPVSWKAHLEPKDARAGEAAVVVLDATIEKPWHIYTTKPHTGLGPVTTFIKLEPGKALTEAGTVIEPKAKDHFDPGFKANFGIFEDAVTFRLPVKLPAGIS